MKNSALLNTFKINYDLDFKSQNLEEHKITLDGKAYLLRLKFYRADNVSNATMRLLNLTRSKNSPHFKWLTSEQSAYGFGDLVQELKVQVPDSQIVSAINHLSNIPVFHSINFPCDQKKVSTKVKTNPWREWKFPNLLIPQLFLEHNNSDESILKLTILDIVSNTQKEEIELPILSKLNPSEDKLLFSGESIIDSSTKKATWANQVKKLLNELNSSESQITKVVLARIKTLQNPKEIDPLRLFDLLSNEHDNSQLTHFYLEDRDLSFLGFSPENLLKRDDEQILIDAIAGTRRRSKDKQEDKQLEEELINSIKEQAEHANVIDAIEKYSFSYGTLKKAKQTVLKLTAVQHLKTPLILQSTNRERIGLYQLAKILHPTPAVGGTPRAASIKLINELEDFDRGLYSGAIGLQSSSTDQFIVAIRSLLAVAKKNLHLFAGAGIVQGSDAQSEWDELNTKFDSFFLPKYIKYTEENQKLQQETI